MKILTINKSSNNSIATLKDRKMIASSLSLFFRMYSSVTKTTDQALLLYLLKSNVERRPFLSKCAVSIDREFQNC